MATEQRLPASLRNQVAAADQIQAQLDAITAAAPPPPDPFNEVLTHPDPVAAPTAPPPPAAPVPPPPPPTAPPPPATTTPQALTPEELRSILDTNARVTEYITRQTAPAPAPAPTPAVAPPSIMPQLAAPHNDEALKQIFGDDVLTMVDQKISRALEPLVQAFRKIENRFNSVGSEVSNVAQRTALTAEQQMIQYLDTAVPSWKEINKDQKWLQWLQDADPIYGEPKQAALDRAVSSGDGVRVANVFKAYLSTLPPPPAPVQPNNAVESMVTPVTVAGEAPAAPPPASPTTIFTSHQVQSFYNDLSRGKYRGKEAEAKKIADAIDEAGAAGRITR